jgi:hypothetical protein
VVAAVRSAVKRLLGEMNLDERIRRQLRLVTRTPTRLPTAGQSAPGGSRPPAIQEPEEEAETQVLPTIPDDRRDKRRP